MGGRSVKPRRGSTAHSFANVSAANLSAAAAWGARGCRPRSELAADRDRGSRQSGDLAIWLLKSRQHSRWLVAKGVQHDRCSARIAYAQ